MALFARRRLQSMMDELSPYLMKDQGRGLLRRLNDEKRVDQALPAEIELAFLWAIASLGDLELEPEWWEDNKRPDAITESIVINRTTAVEIAATNDNSLSGESVMDAIALQIGAAANRKQKGVSRFLYYTFRAESTYSPKGYFLRRLAPKDFQLTNDMDESIAKWISSGLAETESLHLKAKGLDVVIEKRAYPQVRYHNIHSHVSSIPYSIENNPLFDLLCRKKRQLKAAAPGTIRMIFVADIGSTLLRYIGCNSEHNWTNHKVSGSQIITHFMHKYAKDVDAVVTFSPHKNKDDFGLLESTTHAKRKWNITYFGSAALPEPPEALQKIAEILPEPRCEGYQARSLFRQGFFSLQGQGQYLDMTIKVKKELHGHCIKFPSRMLLDLLAGRMTEKQFRQNISHNGSNNIFQTWLNNGMTISKAEMASRNIDEDDDHIILHFSDDPAARPFKLSDD